MADFKAVFTDGAKRFNASMGEIHVVNDGTAAAKLEMAVIDGYIVWRNAGASAWNVLIALSELKGDPGYTPVKGVDYFDGAPGKDGKNGTDGAKGDPGYTPVKGVDYFTDEEIDEVATEAARRISFTLDDVGNLYYELEE